MKKACVLLILISSLQAVALDFSLSNNVVLSDPSFLEWRKISLTAAKMVYVGDSDKQRFSLSEDPSPIANEREIIYDEDVAPMRLSKGDKSRLASLSSNDYKIDWQYSFYTSVSNYGSSVGNFISGSTQLAPDLYTNFGFGVERVNGRKGYSDGKLYQLEGGIDWFPSSSTHIRLNFITDYYDKK